MIKCWLYGVLTCRVGDSRNRGSGIGDIMVSTFPVHEVELR